MENQMELLMNEMRTINMKLDLMMATKKEVVQSDLMNMKEACIFTKLGKSKISKIAADNEIPFFIREGSSIRTFSRKALNDWNTNVTSGPYNLQVDNYLHKKLPVQKVQKNYKSSINVV